MKLQLEKKQFSELTSEPEVFEVNFVLEKKSCSLFGCFRHFLVGLQILDLVTLFILYFLLETF